MDVATGAEGAGAAGTGTAGAANAGAGQAGASPPPPGGGAAAAANPATTPSSWYNDFKSADLKTFAEQKKFVSPEQVTERYYNLEKFVGVPEDRLIRLPEKMEGQDARAVFEKLGAPKDAKGYEIPVDPQSGDPKFVEWAETTFFKNNLTKDQAKNLFGGYNDFVKAQAQAMKENNQNAIIQADTKLKGEWGAQYDANINIAKQGAMILGLDQKTLNLMEVHQGREQLLKTLHKIGVGVGESSFVDGASGGAGVDNSPEKAQDEILQLKSDMAFRDKLLKGDTEAKKKWNDLHQKAYPGEKHF